MIGKTPFCTDPGWCQRGPDFRPFLGVAAHEDGFTLLELTRKYYREAGLDVRQLDLLIR
jgi:hypothetical protein